MKQIPILFFLFVGHLAYTQNTFLWLVKTPDSLHLSYIIGTFHQLGNSFIDSFPIVFEKIKNCETAIFENIEPDSHLRDLLNDRQPDSACFHHLKKSTISQLQSFTQEWGVPLTKLHPAELIVKLQQEYTKRYCETIKDSDKWQSMDNYLLDSAEKTGLEVKGLESDSQMTSYINVASAQLNDWNTSKKLINQLTTDLKTGKNKNSYCYYAREYMQLHFDYQFDQECGESIIIKDRNENWMPEIISSIESKNTIIIVGLLHLYGECGLISSLKNAGFSVEPVPLITK